jgi:shikimate dehydrogenase
MTYGLIGKTLSHSFSQSFFSEKFQSEGIAARYLNFEMPEISEFPLLLAAHPDLRGLNVTIPYKESVIPYLTELTPEARAIGAVNTIAVFNQRTIGHNTDARGFLKALRPFLTRHHHRALILGTGGAAKAARYALSSLGVECLMVCRHESSPGRQLHWSDMNEAVVRAHLLIVNCTPLGMYPQNDSFPALPYEALTPDHLLFDMVYNPPVTVMMEKGRAAGAIALNGSDMLRFQAEEAWGFWGSLER